MIHPATLKKQRRIVAALLALILLTFVAGAGLGYSSLSYGRILPTLLGDGTFKEQFVLFSVRLPRMLITLLSGMALALSGAILQGVTRNDLADPGILGINAGAGAAVAVMYLYVPVDAASFAFAVPFAALLGALLAAGLLYALAYRRNAGLQPVPLVLMGVGLSIALSGLMVVLVSSAGREKVDFIAKWLAGGIWGADWPFIAAFLPWVAILAPYAMYKANRLNLLGMSDPAAIGVGLSIEKERMSLLFCAVALAASAVSVTGGIAFVGLMAPHIARSLIGPRHQLMLPIALLTGGLLLSLADTVGRNLTDPDGIPAGIVVSLLGAPYFIYLLLKRA